MALIEEELVIKKMGELLKMRVAIPDYQRPYRWSDKSTNTFFYDTYRAFKDHTPEYRLGSIILHKHKKSHYDIVDGQQRLTTLAILLYCLGDKKQLLLKEVYSEQSNEALVSNFGILKKRVHEMDVEDRQKYKEYLLDNCSMVQIVTDNEQEAFQFFDSQNSRGKELAPHDLLKSYHLREMNQELEEQKISIVKHWEAMNQTNLSFLFKSYLYPTTRWYKARNGLGYSSKKIDAFKGIKSDNDFQYAIYHRASHLFLEHFNSSPKRELRNLKVCMPFQLTQPIIAGKRFFDYTTHYDQLLKNIQTKIAAFMQEKNPSKIDELLPSKGAGDRYIKQLYECALLFFADRFGLEYLHNVVFEQLYSWCYSLRLMLQSVYPESINKYAQGQHERINHGLDLFRKISEMNHPDEMKRILLDEPDISETMKEKYGEIYTLLCKLNGWNV